MDSKKKLMITVIAFAAVIAVSFFAYGKLSGGVEKSGTSNRSLEDAYDFTMKDYDILDVKLSDLEGKPVIINYWATWCPPCNAELPLFESAYKEYGDRIEFVMLNNTDGQRDSVDSVKSFIKENGYTFPVYFDTTGEGAAAYSVSGIPVTYFITRDGKILSSHTGVLSEEKLNSVISELLK